MYSPNSSTRFREREGQRQKTLQLKGTGPSGSISAAPSRSLSSETSYRP
jgi:hypothetical protein